MDEPKKWIHILTIDVVPKDFLGSELRLLFGNEVRITSSRVSDNNTKYRNPTVVLTTGDFLLEDAKRLFPYSIILTSRRDIGCKNLDKVIAIPKNSKVLVVTHPRSASETTIDSLVSMGFDHLEYIPYFIGADVDFKSIDIAISPAMMHICPKEIKNRIDIGPRTISFSTLSQLLEILELEESYLDQFLYQYNRGITSISYMLSEEFQKSEAMRKNLNIILDEMDDAIISVNEDESIIYINNTCEKLINASNSQMVKKSINEVLRLFKEYPRIKEEIYLNRTGVFTLDDRELIVTYIPLYENYSENSIIIMKRVDELQKLEEDIRRILHKKGYTAKYTFGDIIGISKEIKNAINIAKRIAISESTVIITGESGTGKEVFAQAIHNGSLRSKASFVAVNLASLPENLIESELFGYSDGAFTGARKGGKAGLFEQAHKGTIFIDEIGDISLTTQARLLRVLQEREVMRIGDNKIINIDIRFIAATNKNLKRLVEEGRFREDLYYRLNVLPIHLPPLRERREDIELLINDFLETSKSKKQISKEVMKFLINYDWPGNVRELINIMEYLTQISSGYVVNLDELPAYLIDQDIGGLTIGEKEIDKIDIPFDKVLIKFILETLIDNRKKNTIIGRRKLAELSIEAGFYSITEEKIRNILRYLELENLVNIGKTKQGTMITKRGENYLGDMGE